MDHHGFDHQDKGRGLAGVCPCLPNKEVNQLRRHCKSALRLLVGQ